MIWKSTMEEEVIALEFDFVDNVHDIRIFTYESFEIPSLPKIT